jgi:hypothetical protein
MIPCKCGDENIKAGRSVEECCSVHTGLLEKTRQLKQHGYSSSIFISKK